MIEKKDWESALKQFEAIKVNDMVSKQLNDDSFEEKLQSYDRRIEFCKKKIAEFPEVKEDEKIEKEVKDLFK